MTYGLELENLTRKSRKLFTFERERQPTVRELKELLELTSAEWEDLDRLAREKLGASRIDSDDMPEGLFTFWFHLED